MVVPDTRLWRKLEPFRIRNVWSGKVDPWHHGSPCGGEPDARAQLMDSWCKEVAAMARIVSPSIA
eukprot:103461-Lingulodinium_polyedra.AAC.1